MKTTASVNKAHHDLVESVQQVLAGAQDKDGLIHELKKVLFVLSNHRAMPVDFVRWVPLEDVECNDYNPNSVARTELKLLQLSILNDGYTQPVVTFWDEEKGKYVIVDGFHRYYCCKTHPEINKRTGGKVPLVVIDKSIADRMASTVRHNRARGKHSVEGMSELVFKMLEEGMTDATICQQLGMEPEELIKLKHLTGFSKLFEDVEYRKAWETSKQVKLRMAQEAAEVQA